ncbi:MAG: metallophosphoesterase [Clostridia bacterium]
MIYAVLIILCLIIAMILYMFLETFLLKVSRVSFSSGKSGLKILHISDIHIKYMNVSVKKIQRVIKFENPDLILLSGDYINSAKNTVSFLNFLDKITGFCKIVASLGNHEYEAFPNNEEGLNGFIGQIKDRNVEVLQNQTLTFEIDNKKYKIIGLKGKRNVDIDPSEFNDSDKNTTVIVLSHNPDTILQVPKNTVDYMFCGHFHGGQIWMPFNLEYLLLRNDKLCRMGMKRGLHEYNGIKLYISRGLGCVCVPFRFLSIPEISVYTL